MSQPLIAPWLFSIALLLGLIVCVKIGFVRGKRHGVTGDVNALSGSVFGLLGLLLAFSFSGAASRFDHVRDLVTEEANATETVYLRIDVLPVEQQGSLREALRHYLQHRLDTYQFESGSPEALKAWSESRTDQHAIWMMAIKAAQKPGDDGALSLIAPALNDMFNITTTRLASTRDHPPAVIDLMLFVLAMMSALLAGYGMGETEHLPWLQVIIFAIALSATVFVIRDLEYPRMGLIRVDTADELLIDTLHDMASLGPVWSN